SVAAHEALAGASLDDLRRKLPTRYWVLGVLSLMGKSTREIAALGGYAGSAPVVRVLRHPAGIRLFEQVRRAQLERVLSGTYGVQATAKAAATEVMAHVAELAGGVKDKATGERKGRARRDADALRAAELTLTVSGGKVAGTATRHVYTMLEEFSDSELEALAERGERLKGAAMSRTAPPARQDPGRCAYRRCRRPGGAYQAKTQRETRSSQAVVRPCPLEAVGT